MQVSDPHALMLIIIKDREDINYVSSRLINNNYGVFGSMSLPIPQIIPYELGFIRVVSWLFVLYNEAGKVNVDFLRERFTAFDLDQDNKLVNHYRDVQLLRTFLQHNLNLSESRDKGIQNHCEQWFQSRCGTILPEEDHQWLNCLTAILMEATDFLIAIKKVVRGIEKDESRNQIIVEWNFHLTRYHPPHEFDRLIAIVAGDMGRKNIDPVKLRKRFYEKWIKELEIVGGSYDFDVEARKLIEHTLLTETTPVLPLTGADIILEFGIEPGPLVGELLKKARLLYDQSPCSREQLMEKLKLSLNTPP